MSRAAKIFACIDAGSRLSFVELIDIAEALDFVLVRQRGSHRVYRHSRTRRQLNLQNESGNAGTIDAVGVSPNSRSTNGRWESS
jgi:predicted RNA binding protein YcfA (HicA-like mRNA interferase family)